MFRFILKPGRTVVYIRAIDKNIGPAGYETDKQAHVAACAAHEGLILVGSDTEAKVAAEQKRIAEYRKTQAAGQEVAEPEAPPPPRPEPKRVMDARTEGRAKYDKPQTNKRK